MQRSTIGKDVMRAVQAAAVLLLSATAAATAQDAGSTSKANPAPPGFEEQGQASWYAGRPKRQTASKPEQPAESSAPAPPTAAHPSLPKGSRVEVTNMNNGKSTEVEVNDRGPREPGRVIDLSEEAAKRLDMKRDGVAPVKIETPDGEAEKK
jgi:rare lipoprotein A